MPDLMGYIWLVPVIVGIFAVILFHKFFLALFGIILISQDSIGVVTKKFRIFGKTSLPDGTLIALNGEAGIQADTLPPGLHLGYWPWQFSVQSVLFTEIPEGQVGIVEARDGAGIHPGRTFAKAIDCDSFQNARAFLTGGGQRGSQIDVIRPGVYRINTSLFTVRLARALRIPDNKVGLVTTNDGQPLSDGEIAGPIVTGHDKWQNGQAFIDAGGYKGRQEEIIQSGIYFHNPEFVQVELVDLVNVPIGYVGVVNAFVGKEPLAVDIEDRDNQANIVKHGEKGVWDKALDPGRYAINTYTHKIELVPTTNIVLNWAGAKSDAHTLDRNLSTITVRSQDGFAFNLDVSQIIHISPYEAAKVIARFGSVQNLVSQVLEPLIGNYFRNSAQEADIIDFLSKRTEQQAKAKEAIDKAISGYSVQSVDTLIGDIVPPAELMATLTDRKIAQQQVETYGKQKEAAEARQTFEQAASNADTMRLVVDAERAVQVAELTASAQVKTAAGNAEAKTINAKADAEVLTVVGEATAKQTLAVGNAEAEVLRAKVDAVGASSYASMAIVKDLAEARTPLVPQVLATGGGNGAGSGLADALIGNILAQGVEQPQPQRPAIAAPKAPEAAKPAKATEPKPPREKLMG